MPQFIPLRFYQYNWNKPGLDPESVISPPYDVLSVDDKAALAGTAFNVVHLDSPASYRDASIKLNLWIRDNILIRDHDPGFYIMATDYNAGSSRNTRWGVFGGLKVHPFAEKKVFPHEQTYPKAKNDRLSLMKSTHGQLSPIFGIYDDPLMILESIGQELLEGQPLISFSQEPGVHNRIWRIPQSHNPDLTRLVAGKKIFIADGHHRYETALDYKGLMPADPEAPWNHVFIYLSNISSPGLEIFPYHRTVSWEKVYDWERIITRAEQDFRLLWSDSLDDLSSQGRPDSFVLYRAQKYIQFTSRKAPHDTFSRIGAYVLDQLFLRRAMDLTDDQLAAGEYISYTHHLDRIIDEVDRGSSQAGFILRSVPVDVLQDVCETGQVMPRKSTFFYPKLPTGVLFHLWGDYLA